MTGTVLESILAVFMAVIEWISEAVTALIPLFYAEGALTFLGVLCIASLAIAVAFLMLRVIQNFMSFRS